ncbi:hypothetical protein YC2023_082457 [Brassica napus]
MRPSTLGTSNGTRRTRVHNALSITPVGRWGIGPLHMIFRKRHIGEAKAAANKRKEFQVVIMLDFRVYLFNVNLLNPSSMERIGKLISLDEADRFEISQIFHCSGLLLCITKDKSRLVVWNPCSGQTRWIEPPK